MLGRRKTTETQAPRDTPGGPGKNRPTPKRREVEAARRQPLVPTGRAAGTKGASKASKQAAREERLKAREQMMAGNERFLGVRDRGPVRRYVREVVDTRRNIGELLLPVMLAVLVLSFLGSRVQRQNPAVYTAVLAITYAIVAVAAIDAFLLVRRIRKGVSERFGAEAYVRGTSMYAIMRAFQMRRTRVPRPTVRRGEPPA